MKRSRKRAARPRSRLKPTEIAGLFDRLAAALPEPKGELEYINPFTLLVAVVLSAQATDAGVNKATERLFRVADTPEALLALGEAGLRDYIRTIGLFNTKAKNLIALSRILVEQHGGKVPRDREVLQSLPGVGRKTANVVLNVAFGEPTIAVDTHIFRLCNRTGLAPGKTPDAVEAILERVVPPERKRHAHHWLILHGRYVCKARRPECWRCVIAEFCRFPDKTRLEDATAPVRRTAAAKAATKKAPAKKPAAEKPAAKKRVVKKAAAKRLSRGRARGGRAAAR